MRQISRTQRRLAAGAFLILAGPVALGSVAYACQSLATLHATPASAPAGGTVTLTGKNYNQTATSSNIDIRLNGRNGQVIASFSPRRNIDSETVTIPAGTPIGTHTLVATQYLANGSAASGTPGRASVQVTVAARTAAEGTTAPAATAATPAAATPAAAAAAPAAQVASAPAAAAKGASAATAAPVAGPAAAPAAAAAGGAAAGTVGSPADTATPAAATSAPATPVAAAEQSAATAAAPASVNVGLLPASSSDSSSALPGITLAAGLALVLLGLGAFVKSGRTLGRSPLAG